MQGTRLIRALGLGAVMVFSAAARAAAVAPTVDTVAVDNSFIPPLLSATCGFDVTRHVLGTLTVRTFTDASGNFRRELDSYKLTESLTANGKTLVGRTTQLIFVTVLPNGNYTVSFVATDFRLTVAGSGISFGSVGRFVLLFSSDDELLDVVQDVGDIRADFTAICVALAA